MTLLEHWNAALILCGADTITSFSENKKAARIGAIMAYQARDALLGDHYWNFALEYRQLAEVATPPESAFSHVYELDTDVLCVKEINDHSDEPWIVGADRTLHTDATSVKACIINKETDTSKYPTYFSDALIHLMAFKASYALVQSVTLRDSMKNDAAALAASARSKDGREGYKPQLQRDVYLEARYGRAAFGRGFQQ